MKSYAFGKQVTEILCTKAVPSWVSDADYLWVSLHTDNPGTSNDQTLYEVDYTGYARQQIARTASAWTVSLADSRNAAAITFPEPTGGDGDEIWYLGVGLSETGVGNLLISSNVLDPVFTVSVGEPIVVPIGGLRIRER